MYERQKYFVILFNKDNGAIQYIMIQELIETKCIQIGNFQLKNGAQSKYYFDMKNLISYPLLLRQIGDMMYKQLSEFDIICAVPYGGLPIASYISTRYNKPMIFLRDKPKSYGTQKRIEGNYSQTNRCVIIDDVMTSGSSLQDAIETLRDKVNVTECAVIFDRQQVKNYRLDVKSVYNKTDVVKYRLETIKRTKKSDICFAADTMDYPHLWSILETIGKHIAICKIHFDTVDDLYKETFKHNLIELSIKHNFLIMEDRKFNDISYIVQKQYKPFQNWVDMVTVHSLVSANVVRGLSGVLLVANMSNNDYDFSERALALAEKNKANVVGFITQRRIASDFVCMTPGIGKVDNTIDDQTHRPANTIDADIKIIGRGIYESQNLEFDIHTFLGLYVS